MKRVRVLPFAFIALACALYLPKTLWPGAVFYRELLTEPRLLALGAIAKVACVAMGAFYGVRGVRRLAPTNPARRAWVNLTIWIALWTAAQSWLFVYPFVLGVEIPVPAPSDVGFLLGYAFLFAAQLQFITAYRRTGFPIGTAREHLAIAAVAGVIVLAISYATLAPIARSDTPLAARIVNVAYPALDLAAVVPAIVLLRIALAFRPGRVWAVWATLSASFLSMATADFITTYIWPGEAGAWDPMIHLMYLLAYFCAAWGMKLQDELLGG